MSDEFGTVNVRRGERAREIEVIREQYRRHREALTSMIADAPTEHLAAEYQRLIGELDASLVKLNDLEGPRTGGASSLANEPTLPLRDLASRPLATPPRSAEFEPPPETPGRGNKTLLLTIVGAGLVVLALLGWLMWRSASDERPATPIVAETETAAPAAPDDTGTIVPASPPQAVTPVANAFSMKPSSHDFGTIRKGTRAVRQFELTNTTDQPITITIARSTCRCLYYSHAPVIPPKGKETITVTVDGARAKAGTVSEAVKVSSKADPSITTTMNITATVR